MKKNIISKFRVIMSMALCVAVCCSLFPVAAFAAPARDLTLEESLAQDLKELDLFKGVSDTDFALDRVPSRLEAVTMLVRLLDKEYAAQKGEWEHPFTDVPAWADKYVGYAYENGLTKGISETKFGAGDADAAMYLTFVLRALGYSDTNGEDFTWNDPFTLAEQLGLLPNGTDLDNFLRADVVLVSYAALWTNVKDSDKKLAEKIWTGSIELDEFYRVYDNNAFRTLSNEPIAEIGKYIEENGTYNAARKCYTMKLKGSEMEFYPGDSRIVLLDESNMTYSLLQKEPSKCVIQIEINNTDGEYNYSVDIGNGTHTGTGVIYADKCDGELAGFFEWTTYEGSGGMIIHQMICGAIGNELRCFRNAIMAMDIPVSIESLGFAKLKG